jgi:hypothetical protein
VDREALNAKLSRLAALRGDPVRGLAASVWAEHLDGADRTLLLRAAIAMVRELLIPESADRRKNDQRPQQALEAVERWLEAPSAEAVGQLKATAKACTAAKNETYGYDHRVAEAARAINWAATKEGTHLFEAIASVEEELLARIALLAQYHLAPEQRRAIVAILRRLLLDEPSAGPAAAAAAADAGPAQQAVSDTPVPYSPKTRFQLGQRIVHSKFGDLVVSAVGDSWVEVELADGAKKRLAHAPKSS